MLWKSGLVLRELLHVHPLFFTHTTSWPYTPPIQVIEDMGNLHMKMPGILEHRLPCSYHTPTTNASETKYL